MALQLDRSVSWPLLKSRLLACELSQLRSTWAAMVLACKLSWPYFEPILRCFADLSSSVVFQWTISYMISPDAANLGVKAVYVWAGLLVPTTALLWFFLPEVTFDA